jgi:hypothetical protein
MNRILLQKMLIVLTLLGLASACGASQSTTEAKATSPAPQQPMTVTTESASSAAESSADSSAPDLPADLEAYYKNMVYIQGTAQLMAKFNWSSLNEDNQGVIMSMLAITAFMDNRVVASEGSPLPPELAQAWEKALQANELIQKAVEGLMTTSLAQDEYVDQIGTSEILASDAVTETEAILASSFGASEETIAQANRAALTEMGEDFQNMASMFLVAQEQGKDNSE